MSQLLHHHPHWPEHSVSVLLPSVEKQSECVCTLTDRDDRMVKVEVEVAQWLIQFSEHKASQSVLCVGPCTLASQPAK